MVNGGEIQGGYLLSDRKVSAGNMLIEEGVIFTDRGVVESTSPLIGGHRFKTDILPVISGPLADNN